MKKIFTVIVATFALIGNIYADTFDLDLSKLSTSGGIYNTNTHVISFPASSWTEESWWLDNSGIDFSNCDQFVLEYTTSSDVQFRVYFVFGNGTSEHTEYPTSSSSTGKTTITLDANGKSSIKKIAITAANHEAFTMTLTRAYFTSSSETTGTEETLSSTETAIGDWNNTVNLSWNSKGELANANINDVIKVTLTPTTGDDHKIRIANPSGEEAFEAASEHVIYGTTNEQTFTYTIKTASILEIIQQSGVLIKGKYITVKSVKLIKPTNRYDAVPLTIGSDGIATFSTTSKSLDFNETGITPYYASDVESGKVTLTSVRYVRGWQGYIVKGSAGTYDIPVVTTDEDSPSTNYLKPTGDYSANIYRSLTTEDGTDTKYRYIFAKKDSGTPAFYKLDENYERTVDETTYKYHVLAAHKAYLETATDITPSTSKNAPSGNAPSIMLDFGGGTTAIMDVFQDEMKQQPIQEDGVYYTLQGTRVQNPTKGLYILNGKKIIVK